MTAVALFLAMAWQDAVPARYLVRKPAGTDVLARVDGVEIKAADLEALVWDWSINDALDELLSAQVILNEAKKLSITITAEEVTAETEKGLKQLQESLPPGKTIRAALAEQGTSPSRAYLRMRNKMLLDRIVLRSFSADGFVKVSTIIIKPKNEQTVALSEAIKRADDAYDKLKKGTEWATVLKENTTDAETLKVAGLLGWRQASAFPETVQAEMRGLKAGGITKPAQTVNGFQIFRLEMLGKDAASAALDAIKEQFLTQMRPEVFNKIRSAAKIEKPGG